VQVIYNGIGGSLPMMDRAPARERLGVDPGAFCVLFAGTGWERKGLIHAIRAVESLPFDAVLLVAGRGKPPARAGRRTRFLGATRDLPAIFSAADVFLLPTLYDPFSNACLEASAAGLPVVTTTANGFSEILTAGVDGDAVSPGDVPAIASRLASWRGRDREETARACRALAGRHPLDDNVSRTIAVLRDLPAENRGDGMDIRA